MRKCFLVLGLVCFSFSLSFAQVERDKNGPGKYLFPAEENNKFGYINSTGDVVIPPVFDNAGYFYNGLAAAKQKGKYGFINSKGQWKIKPTFDSVQNFSEGLAAVASKGGGDDSSLSWGFIDTVGKVLETTFPSLYYVTSFHQNRAIVLESGNPNHSIINRKGEVVFVTKDQYYLDEANLPDFHEGFMRVILPGNNQTFIDTSGNLWNKGTYQQVGDFSEGLAWFSDNGIYGFIDREGKVVIPATFEVVSNFSEGLAKTIEHQKYDPAQQKLVGGAVGFINQKGKYIVSPQYEEGGDFHDGFALVKLGGFYGFINNSGSASINFQYTDAKNFFRGLAYVKNDKHWEFINTSGTKVW
jgi:hypothetical protein